MMGLTKRTSGGLTKSTSGGSTSISQQLDTIYQDYLSGRARKDTMFSKGVNALTSYADIFKPGGEYGASIEASIGRGRKTTVASGMQNLVSAGLANTTRPLQLGAAYEEEIAMPARLRGEDIRMERLGGALGNLGQMYAGYDPGTASIADFTRLAQTQAEIESREDESALDRAYSQFAQTSRKPYVSTADKYRQWKAEREPLTHWFEPQSTSYGDPWSGV